MKNLIIVGAGNMARDVLQFIKDINHKGPKWHVKGFIADWGQDIKGLTNGEFDIIGTVEKWHPKENEVFVCAIITPEKREKVIKKLEDRGAVFIQVIHPTVTINDYCKLGKGIVLYPNSSIGSNAKLGNYVVIQSRSHIAHDAKVDDYTTVSVSCVILGDVQIEKYVFIGAQATILPDKKIKENAYVGAGSVVIRDVAKGTKVFGNPAKRLDF